MRTYWITAICLATGLALVGCSSDKPSQDELVPGCLKALRADPEASATHRPDACKGLTEDNYKLVLMNSILRDEGAIDENGDVDPEWLLDQ
ncbi:hypothetical protein ACFYOY_13470 [Streptomyces sp. NPDC007875]|uniref:hypothetical protein n=1 Tax=Streptomyces sp. NPDC007875 TaxID=3364783 RepID=UPI00369B798C